MKLHLMLFRMLLVVILGLLFSNLSKAQYPNFRLHPSSNQQIEPSIAHHPTNSMIMFASAFTISASSILSEGIYVTTNGGISWYGTDTISLANHYGDPGPVITKNGVFILTHVGQSPTGMYSNYSTNSGISWSTNYQLASGNQDKGAPTTDDIASSPFYGRTYHTWTRFTIPFPIVISYTTNDGTSWSPFSQVNNSISNHSSLGPNVSSGPGGQVYVCWAATWQNSPSNEDYIGFAFSTNGGNNWTVNEQAYDCNGIKAASFPPWAIRVNGYPVIDVDKSGGSRNGWIYICTSEKNLSPAGIDPDIILHRSTDGGVSWSAGIRVNQDTPNNGKVQFFPAVRVDEGGGLNVVYYDNRNAAGDSMGVYLSRSSNGGITWSDYQINERWFKPKPAGGQGNMGDNIGMTSGNGKLWPVWMANYLSNDTFQVWSASIDIATIGIRKISSEVPTGFKLEQNYPNPFNPTTTIKFDVPSNPESQTSKIKLIIYNILGQEIATLVNTELAPGTYETRWDASVYSSGVFFYRLVAGNFSETKRMVLKK